MTTAPTPLRRALRLDEAAAALGISRDFFDEHVRPDLRLVRKGRVTLVPMTELDRWLEANASLSYDPGHR
jgi:excisionase family DNA binding protein